MDQIMAMSGWFTSHAIWGVSTGETLIPIVGYLKTDGSRPMERLMMGSVEAMAAGERKISTLDADTLGAVFVKDGLVTLETGKTDALIIDIRFAGKDEKKVQILMPYRHANHADGFAVHRIKVTELEGIEPDALNELTEAYFDGLEAHEQGGELWNASYVDQAGDTSPVSSEGNGEISGEAFEALKRSVFLVFLLVAAADGTVDKKEMKAFIQTLAESDKLGDPLLTRVATNVIAHIPTTLTEMLTESLDCMAELAAVAGILDTNLSQEDANTFKRSLFQIGQAVARASGGFLGFGKKVSAEEQGALVMIALCLGLELTEQDLK